MNPGSPDARQRGCRCCGAENQWGRGLPGSTSAAPMYDVHPLCPMHRNGWHRREVEDGVAARKPHVRTGLPRASTGRTPKA
jgi:hypothetical protein